MKLSPLAKFAHSEALSAIPEAPSPIVPWAEENVHLPGSARSERFRISITPWNRQPLEYADSSETRIFTYVKPVQCGGSTVGEVMLCRWVASLTGGDIVSYWPSDEKGKDRWDTRLERLLRACPAVARLIPTDRFKMQKGLALFPHLNLAVRGVYTQKNVESDSFRREINEEVHDNEGSKGWLPGRLQQAYNRTTAFWNSIIVNISNAGTVGDQLHQAFETGTKQYWSVKCPGCQSFHVMRARWDDKRPELGGLRYDSDKCRRDDGSFDYNRLASTIRYQMPCGFLVGESAVERRQLSLGGQYSDPTNPGAHVSHRSLTLEAVSVDYIPWLKLIQEKHDALRALRYGDAEPWKRYLQERECQFWNPQDRPIVGKIVVNSSIRLSREGLRKNPTFHARFFALDRQQGTLAKGELPHWWLVIRDFLSTGDSLLVFEGKILTDEDVIDCLDRHECVRRMGVADSGDDTTHVYQFCLRYGINAIKGSPEAFFSHGEGQGRRIFSVERPLYQMINAAPTRQNSIEEPSFWFYSKYGIRDRLAWLRSGGAVKWEVPGDVSEDYQKHLESEELVEEKNKRGEIQMVWKQFRDRNDLYVNECYCAMLAEMAGIIGAKANQ